MRVRLVVVLAACAASLAGCGSGGGEAASRPSLPDPLSVSVLISNSRVTVSPAMFGAGPVVFTVANTASTSQSLSISKKGGGRVASSAPLNPQGSTQFSVLLSKGSYSIATGSRPATDANLAGSPPIQAATLQVGRRRAGGGSTLLTP